MLTRFDIRRGDRERGLTLVELIVAMIILMVILTIVSRILVGGMATKSEINADSKAVNNGNQAIEKLAADLRVAEAPGRKTATTNELLGRVPGVDMRDLVVARPYQLQVRAEVDPTVGTECVEYYVDTEGSAWRVVHRAPAVGNPPCSGTIASEQMVAQGVDGDKGAARIPNIYQPTATKPAALTFSYVTATIACAQEILPTVDAASTEQLARVIGVRVGVNASVGTKDSVKQSQFRGIVSFRSRGGLSYRSTIGCPGGVEGSAA